MLTKLETEMSAWCEHQVSADLANAMDRGDSATAVDLYRDLARQGWLQFANITADTGNLARLALLCRVVSRHSGVLANMVSVNAACAIMLGAIPGSPHRELVAALLSGSKLAAFSLTEPQAGSDVQNLQASAEQRDGAWYLNGEKYLATGAAVADVILVATRSRRDQPTNKSTSLWLVPVPSKGLTISPLAKMAANGYASCHLHFDQVALPAESIVGAVHGAWQSLSLGGTIERVLVAASCVGLSERIGQFLYQYAQQRQVDGQPLYALTNIRHQIVDIAIQVRAASALTEQAIAAISGGQNPLAAVCAAKVYAAQMQQAVSMTAMNVMGGRAYLNEYPVERWLREGLLALWAGGTNELQKNLMARDPFHHPSSVK